MGEDWQTAVLREAYEETGLTQLTIHRTLGKIDNELAADECVLTQDSQILSQPDSQRFWGDTTAGLGTKSIQKGAKIWLLSLGSVQLSGVSSWQSRWT